MKNCKDLEQFSEMRRYPELYVNSDDTLFEYFCASPVFGDCSPDAGVPFRILRTLDREASNEELAEIVFQTKVRYASCQLHLPMYTHMLKKRFGFSYTRTNTGVYYYVWKFIEEQGWLRFKESGRMVLNTRRGKVVFDVDKKKFVGDILVRYDDVIIGVWC